MVLSASCDSSLEMISLWLVRNIARYEPNWPTCPLVRLSCDYFLAASEKLQGMKPMGRSAPWAEYLEISFFAASREIARD